MYTLVGSHHLRTLPLHSRLLAPSGGLERFRVALQPPGTSGAGFLTSWGFMAKVLASWNSRAGFYTPATCAASPVHTSDLGVRTFDLLVMLS